MVPIAHHGAAIHDGAALHEDAALLVEDGICAGIVPEDAIPRRARRVALPGGTLCPGFVDLQVNGGGGVMLGDAADAAGLRRIAAAHAALGTAAFLPTLITDAPGRTRAAVAAVREAIAAAVPEIAGLHLEGPHIAPARAGAHDPAHIRPMGEDDLAFLCDLARALPALMVTLAPEAAPPERIAALARAGATVSLGHTDASYEDCRAAVRAGARAVTHLYNAMSQLTARAPGLVGAFLDTPELSAGIIADGVHVHPAAIRSALAGAAGRGVPRHRLDGGGGHRVAGLRAGRAGRVARRRAADARGRHAGGGRPRHGGRRADHRGDGGTRDGGGGDDGHGGGPRACCPGCAARAPCDRAIRSAPCTSIPPAGWRPALGAWGEGSWHGD